METIALDFDGVLRKWPGFIQWYADFLSPQDILARARLFWIRKILSIFFMDLTPVILDGQLINSLNSYKASKLIVVSGRYKEREKKEVIKKISKLLKVSKFYFREDPSEQEWKFKERILKRERADIFLEDRKFVTRYLKSKGINVIHIEEVRK